MSYRKTGLSCLLRKLLLMILVISMSLPTYVLEAESSGELTGCANNATQQYNGVFNPDDFILDDVAAGTGLTLETGKDAINPDEIIIEKEQEVWATYFFEGAGYKSDFGWFLYSDAVDDKGTEDKNDDEFIGWNTLLSNHKTAVAGGGEPIIHPIFIYIKDDNKQGTWENANNKKKGVFDDAYGGDKDNNPFPYDDEAKIADIEQYDDGSGIPFTVDGDGVVTPLDMRKSLANGRKFSPDTEIVFFLASDHRWDQNNKASSTYFSKTDWNPDHYDMEWKYERGRSGKNDALFSCFDDAADMDCIDLCDEDDGDCILACYDQAALDTCKQNIEDCLESGDCHDDWTIENSRKVPYEDEIAGSDTDPGWLVSQWRPGDYKYDVSGNIDIDIQKGNDNDQLHGLVKHLKTGGRNMEFKDSPLPPKFNRRFKLGIAGGESWRTDAGWLAQDAVDNMNDIFGVFLDVDDFRVFTFEQGKKYPHLIVGAPPNDPDQWVLGWDDQPGTGGTDADFNDMVFRIELEVMGVAQLQAANAMVPADTALNYTAVTIRVEDYMPADCGIGATDIQYFIALDGGATENSWIPVEWQSVYEYRPQQDRIGDQVTDWVPGDPEYTHRVGRIDLAERGMTGNQLVWKAELRSSHETCIPEVIDVEIEGDVAANAIFSRSSPIVRTNVIYSGTYETPAASWEDKYMRGHVVAARLYDPFYPSYTDGSSAATGERLWDAGARLLLQDLDARTIYFPDITYFTEPDEQLVPKRTTAGQECTGTLDNTVIQAGSLVITDGVETFTDKHTNQLEGDQGGEGRINRFTGDYYLKFGNGTFTPGADIRASYKYYVMNQALKEFTNANVDHTILNLTDEAVIGNEGVVYKDDLDGDNAFDPVADKNFLVQWTRGYKDGASTKKSWILGAVDHSAPALSHAPGKAFWYESLNEVERTAYDQFLEDHEDEQSILLVGARDGMLHAFDAGHFRWGDNEQTDATEYRGYFDFGPSSLTDMADKNYTYGTGDELWAFIPANLLPRLKNNFKGTGSQAYVDASPAVADVYVDNEWKSVVLSALGNGGDTVFCLDITTPTAPEFIWEFMDPDLFRSKSSPAIGQVGRVLVGGESNWITFFVSGAPTDCNDDSNNSHCYPSIFMLDMADGRVIKRIFLDSEAAGLGGVPSGQPAIVDYDNNGYLDALYVGTNKGFMYKVTLPDESGTVADIDDCAITSQLESIYASPSVVVNEDANGKYVDIFFGTSDNPYLDGDSTPGTTYSFYAYRDAGGKGSCTQATERWSLAMPAGHRIFASAFAAAGKIYFGTSTQDTEDPCGSPELPDSGEGRLYMLNQEDGSAIHGDGYLEVGDIRAGPVVDDEQLYFKTVDGNASGAEGDLRKIGNDQQGNRPDEMQLVDQLSPVVQGWREVTERD